MGLPRDINHFELGHAVSERIEQINDILNDIRELDIVEDQAADGYIAEAQDQLSAAALDVREGEEMEEMGQVEYEDTPDIPDPGTVEWSIEVLDSASGRSICKAKFALHAVKPILFHALEEDLLETTWDKGDIALGKPLMDIVETAAEVPGIVNEPDFAPVVSYANCSGMLVKALGGEESTGLSAGTGANADERHQSNMKNLRELLEAPEAEANA